mmetsp:Transcript_51559/g.59666  ORF Transcript_51559/g.59666 Transcript_51559/m.59666 type:complete len:494 (+) Transcript_51559:135-1616(+)
MVASDTARMLLLPHGHRSLLLSKTNEDEKKYHQEPTSTAKAASLCCSEIILGELVGTGAFCEVHDLYDVKCKRLQDEDEDEAGEGRTKNDNQQREYIYQTCQDTMGNSRYVVKHLRPNLSSDRSYKVFNHARADCLREFEILSRLSHPNIVQLCGYNGGCIANANNKYRENNIHLNPNPEHFFIVIEKLEETLTQRILRWIHIKKRMANDNQQQNNNTGAAQQQQLLPPFYVEKLRFARDIASALTHIHSLGMVFRDLKPDNVGISIDGTVKLFDFGLCRNLPPKKSYNCSERNNNHSSSNSSGGSSNDYKREKEALYRMSTVGTRRYMSPEVISGYCYNQKTDVYSWSMVFFEMLCLKKPFAKYNRSLHKILVCENHGRPYPSMDVPWNSRDLLERAWAQNSFDRPTMKEIYDELCPMIETVEHQTLPITERSLRAVLEISELFVFDNNNRMNPLDGVASPDLERKYSSSSQKTTITRLSVSTMIGSDIAPE